MVHEREGARTSESESARERNRLRQRGAREKREWEEGKGGRGGAVKYITWDAKVDRVSFAP